MNITFRQLRLFLATAETGSVSAAARAMHVTQPTASMQLREITESVGMPLYDIIGRQLHLSDAGQRLAQTARSIVGEWEAFEQSIHAMHGLTQGKLRVAVVSTAKYFVPRLLGSFCEQHPNIDISLEVLNRDGVIQRLRDNRDDLYVMTTPPADMVLEDQVFLSNPLVLIAPRNYALSTRKRLSLDALKNERFLLREKGSGTRLATDRFFEAQNFELSSRLELGSNEAIKEAVAGHLGVAVISRHALKDSELDHELCILPVNGTPIPSQWHLVYPKAKQISPIAAVFQAHLVQQARLWVKD
ncbi:LysR family transcriptional regulator [Limnohabitans radicicola]|uniref:LysR family transcriptional regulator n=1 Tax=Limnohabitans radicicola TaxID=2771427 RepID=A0A927FE70_9BURK|nr:LysR family transcriptional regulator [Limnohabitans radicicola]MBD8049755.1 LysR family transcriptional regulator [Limnohabitans radicicola]